MRTLIALLICSLVLGGTMSDADSAAWKQKRVMVYDYAGPEWRMREAVDRFNAMLPARAPTLVHVQMNGPCTQRRGRSITVCVVPRADIMTNALAQSTWKSRRGAILGSFIQFGDHAEPQLYISCHELFHSMGVFGHASWTDVRPCPYDASIMSDLYKREKRHRKHR